MRANRHGNLFEPDPDPLPGDLRREHEFKAGVTLLVLAIYVAPIAYFGLTALGHAGVESPIWKQWPLLWRLGLAGLFFWHFAHAMTHHAGLWYPLDIWEESFLRRVNERRVARLAENERQQLLAKLESLKEP